MRILVINGHSLHKRFDLPSIFRKHEPDAKVIMLCSSRHGYGSAKNLSGYEKVYTLEDFDTNPDVERIAWNICQTGVDRIIAGNEKDILTAARLRSFFKVPGQKLEEALLFRDKVLMRERALASGLRGPRCRPISSPIDAYAFAEQEGWPVVLKPRRRASSLGVMIARDKVTLDAAISKIFRGGKIDRDLETEYQVEQMVIGSMYSVNGIVLEDDKGIHWPNRVEGSWLGLAREGKAVLDTLMDPEELHVEALIEFAQKLVSSLGLKNSVYHLEVFVEEGTGQIQLCEVACRSPGLLITDAWKKMYDIDLDEVSFLLQAGLAKDSLKKMIRDFDPTKRIVPSVGYLSIPARNGIVSRAPNPAFDGVEFEKLIAEGNQYSHTDHINSLAVLALISGNDRHELQARARLVTNWYEKEVIWE